MKSSTRRKEFDTFHHRVETSKRKSDELDQSFGAFQNLRPLFDNRAPTFISNSNIDLQWSNNRIKNEADKMELSAKRAFSKVTQLEKMFLQWDENGNSGFSYSLVSLV